MNGEVSKEIGLSCAFNIDITHCTLTSIFSTQTNEVEFACRLAPHLPDLKMIILSFSHVKLNKSTTYGTLYTHQQNIIQQYSYLWQWPEKADLVTCDLDL